MIVGRNYRIDSNRNDLSLRPENNTANSVLKGYVLGSDITNFSFLLEETESGIYQLRHNATGLYLEFISGGQIQLKSREVGRIQQSFLIEGDSDNNKTIRYQGEFDTYFKLTADTSGTIVQTAAIGAGQDSYFSMVEIVLSNLAPPTPDKIFRDKTTQLVNGVQPNAEVTLYVNGGAYSPQTNDGDNTIIMNLPPLQVGDVIEYTQTINGQSSGKSTPIKVNRAIGVRKLGDKYRAMEVLLTNTTGDDTRQWQGNKGEPIQELRNTLQEALADITAAGYTTQTYTRS